ncbi:MAG: response regulator transcription factor, partial [Pedobacter sp.]
MSKQLNIVIIEDERKAALDLEAQLYALDGSIKILTILDSVSGATEWLRRSEQPDLIFMDIHLGDGSCFEIFQQVNITSPVVFCTAYDEYALEAFKLNGIGYIVKPIEGAELSRVLLKYRQLEKHYLPTPQALQQLAVQVRPPVYKSSYLIPYRSRLIPVPVDQIACIYVRNEQAFVVTVGQEYSMNKTLEQLQAELDPVNFYRANRQYLVSFKHIKEIS